MDKNNQFKMAAADIFKFSKFNFNL